MNGFKLESVRKVNRQVAGESVGSLTTEKGNSIKRKKLAERWPTKPSASEPYRPLVQKVEAKMQACLDRLGIPLTVVWTPDPSQDKQGQIEESSRTVFIFSEIESEAWETLLHEALELKLKEVTSIYRHTINGLIETIEKICYREKEKFLESVPTIFRLIEEARKSET